MSKELCKLKHLYEKDFDIYAKKVNHPKVICTQCGRAANKKKFVCHPRKIGKVVRKEVSN
jgi:hypothetical protein